MITKEKFVSYINFIHFNFLMVDNTPQNTNVVKILNFLRKTFPKDDSGHSEIDHYIFDLNFGKPTSDSEYISPEELYEQLTNNK